MTELSEWSNFYVIVGSSAGALIGLQFVVLTLIANVPIARGDAQQAGSAFSTPSVVHFGAVLLLSAIVSAPWHEIAIVAALWGVMGVIGAVYSLIVSRRLRRQKVYQPVFEDWLFHTILPLVAYALLVVSVCVAFSSVVPSLFLVSTSALILLFVGIHNAWDTVTYHVFTRKSEP
jgi:hypothetical protein